MFIFRFVSSCSCLFLCLYVSFTLSLADPKCDFSSDQIWKVCGDDTISNKTCTDQLNCCIAPLEFSKTYNITTRCFKTSSSQGGNKLNNGSCIVYNGTTCRSYFNDSRVQNLTNTGSLLRFLDASANLQRTDYIISEFFEALNSRVIKKECLGIISPAMCQYLIPSCYTDNTPQMPCREDCEHVLSVCADDYRRLIGAIQYIAIKEHVDFSHTVATDTCEILKYQWEYDKESNKTCAFLIDGLDRSRKIPDEKPEKKKIVLFIAVGGFAVIFITITAAILIIKHLKRKRQKNCEWTNSTSALTMTSVRDRIRQDAQDSFDPLLELLASSKPGELIQYPLDCVEYIRDLGEGQFGKVFQGRVHGIVKGEESSDVAVKCLKEGSSTQAVEAFHQEVRLMSCLQHVNILRLLAVSTEEEPYCMIFEFMENGDLNEYLRKCSGKESLGDSELIKICKQVASGMDYLASKKFLHRDLATRNCLVGENLTVKIADFGMSRNIYHSDYYRVGGEAMLPIRWMPPEAILYGKFTVAADVYSFGVVLWEIFSFALQPFYGYSNEEVIEFIKKGVLLPQPEDCPDWIYDIMLNCWKREAGERISFSQALQLLKGQFNDEENDSPPSKSSGYDIITSLPTSTYDNPKRLTTSIASGLPKDIASPKYQNLQCGPQENKNEKRDISVTYQNVKPGRENPSYINSSNKGSSNVAFDGNDNSDNDDVPTIKMLNTNNDSPPQKRSTSLDKKTSSLGKIRKALGRKSAGDIHEKSRAISRNRSIKDVLRDQDRYVSTEALKSNGEPVADASSNPPPKILGFRPTSEFLEFHGNGESIKSETPEERETIKKIIDSHKKSGDKT